MRRVLPVGLVLICAFVGSVGCGASGQTGGDAWSDDPEAVLLAELSGSTHVRYDHPRCVAVDASLPWEYACTVQAVGLQGLDDQPLLATSLRHFGSRLVGAGGLTPVPVTCASDVRCWVEYLCRTEASCPRLEKLQFDHLGPNAPPRPLTVEACAAAWNAHGGFTREETATDPPPLVSMAPRRPVYTPHLAPAALGFIASRAEVRVSADGCSVLFDLGGGSVYGIDARAEYAPRFWTWAGRDEVVTVAAEDPAWNACQGDDGTIQLGAGCDHDAGVPARDVRGEIERRYLQQVYDLGGFPYWLGPRFHRARPEPAVVPEVEGAIAYLIEGAAGPMRLLVLTYRPPRGRIAVDGFEVARADPADATVVVVADRPPSPRLRRSVVRALRPFLSTDPYAQQVPGDLGEEPTRVDTSAGVRVYWAGATLEGRRAEVIEDAPPGVGVVRYGERGARGTFYMVTYKPKTKSRCSKLGCVSPPPLPAEIERFGIRVETIILDDWLVEVLARTKKGLPHGALISDRLTRLR